MMRRIIAFLYGLSGLALLVVTWFPMLEELRKPDPKQPRQVPVKRYAAGSAAGVVVMAGAVYFLRRARREEERRFARALGEEPEKVADDEEFYQYK